MKLATKSEMNQLDQEALIKYHIPSLLLMEQAASRLFEYVVAHHKGKRILILCGPGNNGGDGLALARQLVCLGGMQVRIGLATTLDKLSKDGKCYYAICEKLGIPCVNVLIDRKQQEEHMEWAEVIVDGIFGTGLTRNVEGDLAMLLQQVNKVNAFKLSIDMPSGIACDTGDVLGEAIRADCTITFQMGKVGQFLYPGMTYIGELRIVEIGIPGQLVEEMRGKYCAIDKTLVQKLLPDRPVRSNKGSYGKVLMIGGQKGMSGAICMASLGAMRVGAGLVTIAVPTSLTDIVEQKVTEAMTLPLPEWQGHLAKEAAEVIHACIKNYSVVSIGPGLGRGEDLQKIMEVVVQSDKPLVIDADGLHALKPHLEKLKQRAAPVILTPHVGEMSALCGVGIPEILNSPVEYARTFSETYNVIVVLKLERMIVAVPRQDTIYINTKGHQAIAKGGAGDVLTGFVTGLLACSKQPESATLLGCYLHGDTTKRLVAYKGEYSVLPTDLLEYVGESFKDIMSL
ncbi:MAG: NAD(P)H-hydrate dehydratase [Niameybacter sp.]|uniref:NAD(P)H-hydrate dehydratase n=1 Tax=Niameybacter sp. TaxID=2033640 RepID=UPI002FCA3AF9